MNHRWQLRAITLLAAVIVVGRPSIAQANVGTPLMWATLLHLFIGNACIGIFEGSLLARVFRVPASRCIGLMVLANYFTAWVGWHLFTELFQSRLQIDLYNVREVFWGLIFAAYLATIVLEWPFVAGCFWDSTHGLRRTLAASLLVQTASYTLLFGWYGLASVQSLFTNVAIVPLDQISLPANVRIYYIAEADGDVYSRDSSGHIEKVFDLNSRDSADCLSFENSPSQAGFQDLVALLDSADSRDDKTVRTDITIRDENCPQDEYRRPVSLARYPSPSGGRASKLGSAVQSPWEFKAGYWPMTGLSGENVKSGQKLHFALEVPFIRWTARHPIILPTDRVLFQFGPRQICILDPESKQVAVLCYGRGAVAVLE